MVSGWPSRIVGRLVGLRGGTARQSRLRGSVLGSAASRCVDFPSLPHSRTALSVVPTFPSSARSLDSRHFTFVTPSFIYFLIFVSFVLLVLGIVSRPHSLFSLASVLFSELSPRVLPSRLCFFLTSVYHTKHHDPFIFCARSRSRPVRRTM